MSRPPAGGGGRRVDLHTHTRFSDGALEPEALVELALQRSLIAIAVTDHDTVAALPRARAAARNQIEVVPGIEVSSVRDDADLHILGYFIDPTHAALQKRLEQFRRERVERAEAMIERLRAVGAALDRDAVFARSLGVGVVGRPHLADALIQAGHAVDMDDAFRRFLGTQGSGYVPRPAFRTEDAIGMIHDAGGLSVLAHPGAAMEDATIEALARQGLRGIEVWHPQHNAATVRRYHALAHRLGLIETGGSDFHTTARGTPLGELPVPASVLINLKHAAGVAG